MAADKNVVVVAVNSTRPKNYRTIRFEGTRSSWASQFICLGAAVMLLHNTLDGGVAAQCSYPSQNEVNCSYQSPPLVAIPNPPVSTTTVWDLNSNNITVIINGTFIGLTALQFLYDPRPRWHVPNLASVASVPP